MARKMALVPVDLAGHVNMQQHLPSGPILNQLSSLDQDMRRILEDYSISPESKLTQYYNTLRRYDTVQGTVGKIERQKTTPTITTPNKMESPLLDEDLLENVPKSQRNNAKLLLKYVKENPSLKWNSAKELIFNGKRIPGSNIIDLVNDTTRNAKNRAPVTGWKEFTEALMQKNIPRQAVGNNKRWEYIRNQINSTARHGIPSTNSRTSKRRRRIFDDSSEEINFIPSPSASAQEMNVPSRKNKKQRRRANKFDALY